jgi:septum formation protein
MRLYLASTSPARLTTLRSAGIEPIVVASNVDENAVIAAAERAAGPLSTLEMVQLLAKAKADAVVGTLIDGEPIDGFILGCDSAFELDGVTYGKPHLPEVARERWLLQRGRAGQLHSGHWLVDHRGGAVSSGDTGQAGAVSSALVRFMPNISDDEIDAYIATGEPLSVAGAFTIDSLGAAFIASIDGDPHAVVGLSVSLLRELLLRFGVSWPSLWNRTGLSLDL